MAAANSALGETSQDESSGFELERVEEAEEVLTKDAEAALTAADIAESSKGSEQRVSGAAEDAAAPQIHMDLYCGVLEEKRDQDESVAASGVLKLPGGGVLAPPTTDADNGSSSDDEVIITSRTMLANSGSDSDSDSDSDASDSAAGERLKHKILVQEIGLESCSSSLIPGLPDPTDRTLIDECVAHDAHERDVMQHVEEVVRWHRRQECSENRDVSDSKCVEIVNASGSDGVYQLQLVMSVPSTGMQPGQECRQTVAVNTRRTADGDLEVRPVAD